MAIMLYSNGVLEEFKTNNIVFNDDEIISVFNSFKKLRSRRLLDVVNTWCIWGENDINDVDESYYNSLGSSIVEEEIYSPLFFIHDTEIDPEWLLTDEIIYKPYNDFREDIQTFMNDVAEDLKLLNTDEEDNKNLVKFNMMGTTSDRRILHEFNPYEQTEEFYKIQNYSGFANQAFTYLEKYFEEQQMLVIYANVNVVIAVKFENALKVLQDFQNFFEIREKYEKCSVIKDLIKKWEKYEHKVLEEQIKNTNKKTDKSEENNSEDIND